MTPKEKQILSAIAAVAILAGGLVWAAKYRMTPPPSPSPQGGGNETEDWQTYRNDEYGFEVKYPSGLLTSIETGKSIEDPTKDKLVISFKEQGETQNFASIIVNGGPFGFEGYELIDHKEQVTNGIPMSRSTYDVGDSKQFIFVQFQKNNNEFWGMTGFATQQEVATFDQFLSTFKFFK